MPLALTKAARHLATRNGRSLATRTMATIHNTHIRDAGATMPPGHKAKVGCLETLIPERLHQAAGFETSYGHIFELPDRVTGSAGDKAMGQALVKAWKRDGIFQIAMNSSQREIYKYAEHASKRFFAKPHNEKAACIDSQSYAGYIASGEEITDGIADYSEIFTVTKDLDLAEPRVAKKWPCHGPCPWPDAEMRDPMKSYMNYLGDSGEKLLALTELGLGVPQGSLLQYTQDGWHHMRILRFPPTNKTNGKGKAGRGIGSHTDYGLLVIAAQDDVGGLFIRPPYQGENYANWEKSAAGMKEDDEGWVYVPPVADTFTVFPGDMMQYMTDSFLPSTPHKVGLNTRDRFAFAYFHEPSFQAVVKPLEGYNNGQKPQEGIHYGTHFTNMFMRNYPDRITTQRLHAEDRYKTLAQPELRTMTSQALGQQAAVNATQRSSAFQTA